MNHNKDSDLVEVPVDGDPHFDAPKGEDKDQASFSRKWTRLVNQTRAPVLGMVHRASQTAARHPRSTVNLIALLSIGLAVLGLFTGFTIEADDDTVWTPKGSRTVAHKNWIDDPSSGYPEETRPLVMLFHREGGNVLGLEDMDRVFQALDAVRGVDGYDEICAQSLYVNPETGEPECRISGATRFYNHSSSYFDQVSQSDEDVVAALSAPAYPDGSPVNDNDIYGKAQRDESGTLTYVEMFIVNIDMPDLDSTSDDFEQDVLDLLLDGLRVQWENEAGSNFRMEVQADRSFPDEFARAIAEDVPLLPLVFCLMSVFTCIIFFKRDKVRSRSLLGFSAVVSVLFSIMTAHGLMWVCGVPYSSLAPLIPFIIFGIGLDDAFIISGAYGRTPSTMDPVDRIYETMEECGMTVTITTITSSAAFGLGCLSAIPTVFWLCLYSFTTIVMVYFYQLTFFVACIVLDEKRIADNRRDCLVCLRVPIDEEDESMKATRRDSERTDSTFDEDMTCSERIMTNYAHFLMKPAVKVCVVVAFIGLAVGAGFSVTNLKQEFDFTDVLPAGSYVADFVNNFEEYTIRSSIAPFIYVRYADQSDPSVQQQLRTYIDELVAIDAILEPPEFFWLDDFEAFVADSALSDLTFEEQLALFIANPVYKDLYDEDLLIEESTGRLLSSRTRIAMDNIDLEDVKQQVDAFDDEKAVSSSQPINQGQSDWRFFTYDGVYDIWEFYAASVSELIFTTVVGIASVTGIALFFIPHWSAAVIVAPFISILYIDLLGFMQWMGLAVNVVSYISLVLSIGLMVDYLLHILVCYYESEGDRVTKTVTTLSTLGSSILIGGITTFLGTIPLAFSTSEIFSTVFFTFLGLVLLGVAHGLVLLPVILSTVGPEFDPVAEKPSSWRKKRRIAKKQSTRGDSSEEDEEAVEVVDNE